MTPQIQLVAYESRDGRVFIRHPEERGRYLLCEPCVALVGCPHCKSAPGEPCKGAGMRYMASTHFARRRVLINTQGRGMHAEHLDQLPAKPRVKLLLSK